MKFTVPGIVLTALIVASPLAFAENSDYLSTTSQPGASVGLEEAIRLVEVGLLPQPEEAGVGPLVELVRLIEAAELERAW